MSYSLWHQPEYGAALRTPERPHDRPTTTRPHRRRPRRRLRVAVLAVTVAVGAGLAPGAGDVLAASGATTMAHASDPRGV